MPIQRQSLVTDTRVSAQKESFISELLLFVEMTGVEQETQMTGVIPTVEEYMDRRMGSSAVGLCLAITEYDLTPPICIC